MAVMNFPSCKNCNDCEDLLNEIIRRLWSTESGGDKGLVTRYAEQVFGCQTPQNTISPHPSCANHRMSGTWDGHNKAMKIRQEQLRDAVEDYDDDNNDCGDKVADPERARRIMKYARRGAYSKEVPVPAGAYKGPPAPANVALRRTWAQWAQDTAQGICVGGFTAGGTVIGGIGGGVAGAGAGTVAGGILGGGGGTFVLPGFGTAAGGVSGAAAGAVVGGVTGVGVGGYAGYQVGNDLGEWICR